jgi:hypothetical protein
MFKFLLFNGLCDKNVQFFFFTLKKFICCCLAIKVYLLCFWEDTSFNVYNFASFENEGGKGPHWTRTAEQYQSTTFIIVLNITQVDIFIDFV